ncbi:MAG: hypothetical protein AB1Z23_10950 [Eubacteriales bacterium]
MKYLAIEKEITSIDWQSAGEILKKEARQVFEIYLEGILREIYLTEHNNAVLILECKDEDEAREALGTLPLVKEKMIEFDIVQLLPYRGMLRIMAKED